MSKRKICIIGPFPPIKGGISQYNEFLARELQKQSEVYLFSYKRQYPGFLRKNREQLDANYKGFGVSHHIDFSIDSINPFTWITTFKKIRKIKPDLVILPWWVIYWAPMDMFFLTFLRMSGIKSLFICHNIFEHEDNFVKRAITQFTLKKADLFMVHSKSEKIKLCHIVGSKQVIKHLLPLYVFSNFDSSILEKKVSKEKIELLFFGFVREYKGLGLLLEALRQLKDRRLHLTIAGEFWDKKEIYTKFIDLHNIPNIKFIDHYIPDNEIQNYFISSDVVVLPYSHATSSGVIPIAYSYNKPVLVTNVGGLPDAVVHKKTGYIVEAKPSEIANGIEWFIENKDRPFANEIEYFVRTSMSWSDLVENIYDILEA